jgi:hypothetical protein
MRVLTTEEAGNRWLVMVSTISRWQVEGPFRLGHVAHYDFFYALK